MKTSNVKILIVDVVNNLTQVIERNNLSKEEVNKLWLKYLPTTHRSASTSNLGYEPKDFPKYYTSTGYLQDTNTIVTWIEWVID